MCFVISNFDCLRGAVFIIYLNKYIWPHMPLTKYIRLTLLFFLLIQKPTSASTFLYDDSRGLSNNHVTRIVKDRTGLLWIATQNGLNTFDGYSFKEIDAFRGIKINTLCYTPSGSFLWVGSNKGLYRITLSNNKITDYTSLLQKKEVVELFVYKDLLYVVFFHGTVISINSNNEATAVFGIRSLRTKASYFGKNIATDHAGNLYFTLNGADRLMRLDLRTGMVTFPAGRNSREVNGIASMPGYCISYLQNGDINYLGTDKPALPPMFNDPHMRIGVFHCYGNEFYASLRDQFGVFQFNHQAAAWELVKSDQSVSFKSKVITCIFRDAYNLLWVGTNKGLIKIDIESPHYFKILFDGYSPPVSNRQIVEKSKDEFYIATYSGIYQYPLTKSKPVLIDANREDTVFPLYTRALLYDTGYLYAGTESHSNFFYRVNLNKQTCEGYFFKTVPTTEQIGAIYGLMRDDNGVIWMATDIGLASYNKKKESVTLHTHDKFSVEKTRLFYIKRSRTPGKFWISGRNAFYLVDENKGVEKRYTSESIAKPLMQLIADDFIFIDEDTKGKLWIGTKKSGIIVFDTKNNIYENISRADGLSANETYGVLWQNDSVAWISTINGLCRYNTINKTFNNYFYDDGLSDNEFNQNSLFKGSNGNLYFGGINGINYFDPATIAESRTPLTIFLASVVKWNQGLQTFENAINNDQILMSPQDHLLTFTFGLSDFSQTESYSYFYRIKGLYDNWVSLGNQNILRLEGLPAGSYKVEVMGYNKKGIRSQNTLEYTIEIEQVFYKIWWFYVLVALAVVAMVYGYFKWRLRNIDLKLKLRTQIASNLHDEVGSLLTSIIISTDSARYSSNTIEAKNHKLEKISMLSRDATSTMSDVLWSIDARNDYAGNLTDRIREQAEAMLLPLDIEVEFDFTATQQDQTINPDTRQQLYLIFKEAINNIAKHSKATVVKITYKQQGNNFELAIQNNNHAQETESHIYSGQGIKNMQMRAKKIGARCVFDKTGSIYKIIVNN